MQISLNNIRIFSKHGVMPEEGIVGAWFVVNLTVECDCTDAIEHDILEGTISYAELASIIKEEMLIPSHLLEHVAGRIGKRIMSEFPTVCNLTIEVAKENPPICVECSSASVRLQFNRNRA